MSSATPTQAGLSNEFPPSLDFTPMGRTRVQVAFDEPELSSDGGALLIREAAEINGIIDAMVSCIRDERSQAYVQHTLKELLMQRVTQICHGYEDANDCDTLKADVAFKLPSADGPMPPTWPPSRP